VADRTPEEREAARLERERRRAARDGGSPDGAAAVAAPGAAPEAEPAPDPVEPIALREPPATALREFDDEPFEDGEPEPLPLVHDGEVASGTRRVGWREVADRAHRRGRRPKREGAPRKHSLAGRLMSLLALALGIALIWFLVQLFQPFHGSGHGRVTVTVPAHSRAAQVGDLLERDGVISSSFFFQLRATLAGERGSLRPGTYTLKLDMSYSDVLKILTAPPPVAPTTNVTIVPGRTRRQLDTLLRTEGVAGGYFAATRHSRLLNPAAYGARPGTNSLEGFLFPDTYNLRSPITIAALVTDQLETFKQRFATVDLRHARSRHLTAYDVLIIASMVEAEAATARDRPLVASVIYNRLRLGMPLQIDATTRYATGNYTTPLTTAQLNSPSPYNTRIHKGLPPTPIDNPSLAAIQAAAEPANTNYLYFVVKPCGNGEQVFTRSYTQFLIFAQQYQAARLKRKHSPAHC
jgi:uncharacterized YceG family protein